MLGKSRLVSIVGPGGSGKTRLALELLRRRGPHAQVDLSGVDDPAVVEGIVRQSLRDLGGGNGRPLLLIDNCEQVIGECARVAEDLLAGRRELRLLITSREVLGISAERVWHLRPLASDDAARLFMQRARARRPGVAETAADQATIGEICRRLDYLPLAIELAAARVGALSPAEILVRLDDRFALLSRGSRNAAERHRTLRSTVDWSYTLLAPDEQELLRRLSVFRGGFDLEAVEAMAGERGLDRLSKLIDKSVISVIGDPGLSTRYVMLETLSEYGRDRLRELDELEIACRLHLEHFLDRAETAFAERHRSGSAALLHRLDRDLDNLRAALEWCRRSDACAGVRLVAATREVWFRLGQAEGLRAARELIERCTEENDATPWALLAAGNLALTQLQHEEARRYLDRAGAIGSTPVRAWAAWMKGVDRFLAEEHETARVFLEQGVALHRETGDAIGLGNCLASLGTVRLRLGERADAIASLTEALDLFDGCGDRWGAGFSQTYLGVAHLAAGERASAERHFTEALRILGPLHDVTMLTLAIGGLAEIAAPADWPRALRLAGAALSLRERVGGPFPPWIASEIADLTARGRAALGVAAADRALTSGARLEASDAVALALGALPQTRTATAPISGREMEVSLLVAQGLSNDEIADRLHLSRRTVENHVLHILNKLGVANRTQIAVWVRAREMRGH